MAQNTKKDLIKVKNRSFLNKDFESFRSELLEYARTYFPENIQDFSDASLGGLFLDLAAYVGDVSSFYLDHQFRELDPQTAVETVNIERLARAAGVKISGASPAVAEIALTIEVPSEQVGSKFQPQESALPIILKDTTVIANNDIVFNVVDNIDFSERDEVGTLVADIQIRSVNTSGTPLSYLVTRNITCVSGDRVTETFEIPDTFEAFRTLTLSNSNVSQIVDVRDSNGNIYYEVESLAQDTVYIGVNNLSDDSFEVQQSLEVKPAPRRFVTTSSTLTGLTTMRFGSGRGDTLDKDIVPDPSELALPLYGKNNFSRFSIDPENLLKTRSLGISPKGTTIFVQYRFGGGLSHNVGSRAITSLGSISMRFPGTPAALTERSVRTSVSVTNESPANGGEEDDAPVPRNENFGRVFRASVRENPVNPLSSLMFIINRDSSGFLQTSPDSLKKNLSKYLNEFRLIADAIDILDAQIINIGIDFEIAADPNFNKEAVLKQCIENVGNYFNIENFQIEESILISDITNLIYNVTGVTSVTDVKMRNITGNVGQRSYSNNAYNVVANIRKGILFPPPGGIFEVKYPNLDIRGTVS